MFCVQSGGTEDSGLLACDALSWYDSRRFEGTCCLHIRPMVQHHVAKDPNHQLIPILTPCS